MLKVVAAAMAAQEAKVDRKPAPAKVHAKPAPAASVG